MACSIYGDTQLATSSQSLLDMKCYESVYVIQCILADPVKMVPLISCSRRKYSESPRMKENSTVISHSRTDGENMNLQICQEGDPCFCSCS